MIREHIASNLEIEADDFGYAPFNQRGGLGKVHNSLAKGGEPVSGLARNQRE